jgi:hypothetical protein
VFDGPTPDAITHYLSSRSPDEQSTVGEFDVAHRRRDPAHRAILQRVTLASEGRLGDTVRMGQGLRVMIDVHEYRDVPRQLIGISIHTALQQKLLTTATWMKSGHVPTDRESTERVVIDIGTLPLAPGTYSMTIGVWSWGRGCFDLVEDAAAFTVVPADVLGSGYSFEPTDGVAFTDFEWEVRPGSDATHVSGVADASRWS